MERLISLIKNRYVIAGLIFAAWLLFFDRHDLSSQFSYYNSLKTLEKEKVFYETEISEISQTLEGLQHDPAAIERIAREKYQMKKDGEDIYVILRDD
ncbi:MAG TPA: septum formation initiator family protein [Sphingobacteriaceae bacterium]|nr:septum formation initiator family protein [Sphingobacteriaceae bacterium]